MFSILGLLLLAPPAPAPDAGLKGIWETKDKSVLQVLQCSGTDANLCIKIVKFGDPSLPDRDTKNPDASKRSRPLCNLVIGTGFVPDGQEEAKGGKLYDAESGHTYSGNMKLDGADTLKLRGFLGVTLLGRTETWHRRTAEVGACRGA